jgi:hypothetical protein
MPRTAGCITPKYRQHKASGQAIVTIAGHDHYLGPWRTNASKVEYDRLIGEWLAAGRPTTQPAQNDLAVVELIVLYLKCARSYYVKDGQPTGTHYGVWAALRIVKEAYGRTRAIDFGPLALRAVQQRMIDKGQSRRYVNDNIDRVRRMFKWAVAEELLPLRSTMRFKPCLACARAAPRPAKPRLSCQSMNVRSTPHCRICRKWWPIWCDSNSLRVAAPPRSVSYAPATWIGPATCGAIARSRTRRNTTAESALFSLGPRLKACYESVCSATNIAIASFRRKANGSGAMSYTPGA